MKSWRISLGFLWVLSSLLGGCGQAQSPKIPSESIGIGASVSRGSENEPRLHAVSEGSSRDKAPRSSNASSPANTSPSPEKKKAPRPEMSAKAQIAFDNGGKALRVGDLAGAKSQYSAAILADTNAYRARFGLGVVYERLGMGGKAKSAYLKALSIVADHEQSISAYSQLLARENREGEALSFLQKKLSEGGQSAALLASLAEVKSLQGESGKAQELAQQALKLDPGYKPAMVVLARDHYRARRIDLALYALKGILDGYGEANPPRDTKNAEARLLRGTIFVERGLRGPAMKDLEAALEGRPDLVDAHLLLANYMMEAGNAKGARTHLEMAVRFDNKNVQAHLQLGDAYRLLGRLADSRRELEWVLQVQPNRSAAHYNLGLLFLLGGKMDGVTEAEGISRAIRHLEAYKAGAARGGPDDVDDLITRAKTKRAVMKAVNVGMKSGG